MCRCGVCRDGQRELDKGRLSIVRYNLDISEMSYCSDDILVD